MAEYKSEYKIENYSSVANDAYKLFQELGSSKDKEAVKKQLSNIASGLFNELADYEEGSPNYPLDLQKLYNVVINKLNPEATASITPPRTPNPKDVERTRQTLTPPPPLTPPPTSPLYSSQSFNQGRTKTPTSPGSPTPFNRYPRIRTSPSTPILPSSSKSSPHSRQTTNLATVGERKASQNSSTNPSTPQSGPESLSQGAPRSLSAPALLGESSSSLTNHSLHTTAIGVMSSRATFSRRSIQGSPSMNSGEADGEPLDPLYQLPSAGDDSISPSTIPEDRPLLNTRGDEVVPPTIRQNLCAFFQNCRNPLAVSSAVSSATVLGMSSYFVIAHYNKQQATKDFFLELLPDTFAKPQAFIPMAAIAGALLVTLCIYNWKKCEAKAEEPKSRLAVL